MEENVRTEKETAEEKAKSNRTVAVIGAVSTVLVATVTGVSGYYTAGNSLEKGAAGTEERVKEIRVAAEKEKKEAETAARAKALAEASADAVVFLNGVGRPGLPQQPPYILEKGDGPVELTVKSISPEGKALHISVCSPALPQAECQGQQRGTGEMVVQNALPRGHFQVGVFQYAADRVPITYSLEVKYRR